MLPPVSTLHAPYNKTTFVTVSSTLFLMETWQQMEIHGCNFMFNQRKLEPL